MINKPTLPNPDALARIEVALAAIRFIPVHERRHDQACPNGGFADPERVRVAMDASANGFAEQALAASLIVQAVRIDRKVLEIDGFMEAAEEVQRVFSPELGAFLNVTPARTRERLDFHLNRIQASSHLINDRNAADMQRELTEHLKG